MFLPDRYVEGTCPVCANPDARGDQCEKCGTYLDPLELINPRSKITGRDPGGPGDDPPVFSARRRIRNGSKQYVKDRNARDGWKENVLKYCRGWFKDGLQDRAVTRDLDWGVKVPLPGYEHKVIVCLVRRRPRVHLLDEGMGGTDRGTPDAWKRVLADHRIRSTSPSSARTMWSSIASSSRPC